MRNETSSGRNAARPAGARTMQALKQIAWPLAATLGSVGLLIGKPLAMRALDMPEPEAGSFQVVRLLLGAAAYFGAAWLATRLAGLALSGGGGSGRRRSPRLLQDLLGAVIFGAAALATIALVFEGSVLGAAATSGVIVAVLGFSLRGVMADIFAGVALGLERAYRIGDWIAIEGGLGGRVIEINWRSTRIETLDRVQVVVPNGRIAQQRVTNYSAPRPHYRQQVRLTLDHALPAEEARRLLAEAAATAPGVLPQPAPDARLAAYEPDGLVYVVRYWVPSFAQEVDCRDAVLTAVDGALRRRAVPAPHRRHRMRLDQPDGTAIEDALTMLRPGPGPTS
ncbi:mechanosensitive ion channel family protein [Siccirubricoccus sp. G192]|uniref:mechanosensitive ion channel family protein n=1 Tax=Siccirubricoccus sp. G192 TaxID=2849651 RepID=UPI001C2C99EA|nr:mechanosensitive ion channel family protein [Siccirubricoccus sp. G192]MBV1796185.1 mechanosensitive ion channel family protein [Siccirubricoccus sp. G192]